MNEEKWISWKMQTSKTWEDMKDVLALTQIDFIDYDHRILVEYAIKLNQQIHQLDHDFSLDLLKDIGALLEQLYDYAKEHFYREEIFMDKYQLPEIRKHKMEHHTILKMLQSAIDDFRKGKVTVSHELKIQVMAWLIDHINVIDHEFFDISHWRESLILANDWSDVKDIISLTGINEIDRQHRDLTEKAIGLFAAVDNQSRGDLRDLMEDFKQAVHFHFSYEAGFMGQYDIKDTDHHLEEHQYFVERLIGFSDEILSEPSKVKDMKVWLLSWWINHINVTDHDTFMTGNWIANIISKSDTVEELTELLRLTHIHTVDHDHLEVMKSTFQLSKLLETRPEDYRKIKPEILAMMTQIYKQAESHFAREEKIMRRFEMKDTHSHFSEHQAILHKLTTMVQNLQEDRLYASRNIKTMILDWWLNHTNTVDYRTFVINVDDRVAAQIREEENHGAN